MTSGPLLTAPVVSTQWLADHLGADNLVVLDAAVLPITLPNGKGSYVSGHDRYLVDGHVPGAFFADIIEDFSDPAGTYPFSRPTLEQFEKAAGALGIDNETTVVVYDVAVGQWASRLWWLFRTFGYDSVAVLDGGFTKWTAESRPTDQGHLAPVPASFTGAERPELWVDKAYVDAVVRGDESAALVCGLSPAEFAGESGSRARLGHIPGSVNVPVARMLDRESNAFLPQSTLAEKFGPALESERIVAYCAAGIAATANALALTLLGHRNVAVYDESLNEWAADDEAPLAVA